MRFPAILLVALPACQRERQREEQEAGWRQRPAVGVARVLLRVTKDDTRDGHVQASKSDILHECPVSRPCSRCLKPSLPWCLSRHRVLHSLTWSSPSALQLARDGVETSLFSVKKSLTTVHRLTSIAFMGLHSLLNQEHSSLQTHSYTAPVPYQHSFQANIGPALVQTFSSAAVCV